MLGWLLHALLLLADANLAQPVLASLAQHLRLLGCARLQLP
jgi:hypothetical protein